MDKTKDTWICYPFKETYIFIENLWDQYSLRMPRSKCMDESENKNRKHQNSESTKTSLLINKNSNISKHLCKSHSSPDRRILSKWVILSLCENYCLSRNCIAIGFLSWRKLFCERIPWILDFYEVTISITIRIKIIDLCTVENLVFIRESVFICIYYCLLFRKRNCETFFFLLRTR